jgi:hypothetical protein
MVTCIGCISRKNLTRAEEDHVLRFANQDVPWDHFVALASMHGVDGFIYYHMNNLGLLNRLPQPVLGRLEETYARTRKHSLAILQEAEALSLRFEKARIPVIALQGLSLLATVYVEPGLRQLGDIDLMVKPHNKQRLKELLYQNGYRAPYPHYPDILHKANFLVDIHTHVLNLDRIRSRRYLFPEDLAPMWEKATSLFNQHDGLLALDPWDNFVVLSAHALKHSYSRMIWLADLQECLLTLPDTSSGWQGIEERARFWQQEKVVLYALILVEGLFGLKIPFWIKRELGIPYLHLLEKHLLRLRLRGFSSSLLRSMLWLYNIKGTGKRMAFIKETVFPRDEIMVQIFDKNPRTTKSSLYAKRIKQGIIMLGENVHQAIALSLKSHLNE